MVSGSELLFYVVLLLGASTLLFVNMKSRKVGSLTLPPSPPASSLPTTTDLVHELLTGPVLTAERGRQWLDRLLDQQQEDEPKK